MRRVGEDGDAARVDLDPLADIGAHQAGDFAEELVVGDVDPGGQADLGDLRRGQHVADRVDGERAADGNVALR